MGKNISVTLTCISLTRNEVKHSSMCLVCLKVNFLCVCVCVCVYEWISVLVFCPFLLWRCFVSLFLCFLLCPWNFQKFLIIEIMILLCIIYLLIFSISLIFVFLFYLYFSMWKAFYYMCSNVLLYSFMHMNYNEKYIISLCQGYRGIQVVLFFCFFFLI